MTKKRSKQKAPARKARAGVRLQGRGSYTSNPSLWERIRGSIPRAIGGVAGALVGKADAGWEAGADFSRKILGWGDYAVPWTVSMNSLVTSGQAPSIANVGDSGMRVVHREYITSVYSTVDFTNTVYRLNPGLGATFPWLSKIAANFQQYVMHGAVVTFKSSLTNAVATFSSLGALMIAVDMNSAASPAASQSQIEQYQFVASAKPNDSIVAPIECKPSLGGAGIRYLRSGTVPAGASILDFDHGTLQIATVGQPSAGVELGRIYISYDITLLNPKLTSQTTGAVAHYKVAAPTSAYPFGLVPPVVDYDSIGCSFSNDGTGYKVVTIPANVGSELEIVFTCHGVTSGAITYPSSIVLSNLTPSSRKYATGAATDYAPSGGETASHWKYSQFFHVIDPTLASTFSIANCTMTGTPTADILISVLPVFGSVSSPVGPPTVVVTRLNRGFDHGYGPQPLLPEVVEEDDDVKEDNEYFLSDSPNRGGQNPMPAAAAAAGPLRRKS